MFWAEIGSGFGEPGSTPPPRIPRSTPRDDRNRECSGKDISEGTFRFKIEAPSGQSWVVTRIRFRSAVSVKTFVGGRYVMYGGVSLSRAQKPDFGVSTNLVPRVLRLFGQRGRRRERLWDNEIFIPENLGFRF